jgi:transposase
LSLTITEALYFVGIDWAAAVHAVCVLDATGRKVGAFRVEHAAAGLDNLLRRLARLGYPDAMPVAIERPDGHLVDVLLEAGHPVVPVKPNAIKTWRDGEVLSGVKSDDGDAEVIAECPRPRHHRPHLATPYSLEARALRTVVRTRSDLVERRVAVTNHLSVLLVAHWSGAKAIFADVESPIALAFLTRYPTARHAQHLSVKRLKAF